MNTQSFPMASSETEELTSWQCIISHEMQCNGFSMCLTDECQCADIDVFYCADKVGCIAHANVCDGKEDCRDGSDECMCDDVIHCQAHGHTYCVPLIKYCMNRDTIYSTCIPKTEVKCSVQLSLKKTEKEDHPMFQCTYDYLIIRLLILKNNNKENWSLMLLFLLMALKSSASSIVIQVVFSFVV